MNLYDEEAIEKFKKCGKILRETREEIKDFVRVGRPIIEICEKAEALIKEKGGKPAFPCNVSINEIAAHYTSPPNDKTIIPEKSIVKVDIGAHLDGYVTDTAFTKCFNQEYISLVETAQLALDRAIANIRPNVPTSKIGSIIEKTVKSRGFKPISNLTGHSVGRYLIHAGTSIPNVSHLSFSKIKLGGVYAIEPFVTVSKALGRVEDSSEVTIFRFLRSKSLKKPQAKQLSIYIKKNFRTLPFAERWLKSTEINQLEEALKELFTSKSIMGYPVFIEVTKKVIGQAEHTVLIVEDGCVVLT